MDTTALSPEVKTVRPSPAPRLTLAHISKSFPGVRALHDVGLSLYPGEVTALIGENGAGKSTLVKILTGIYQPDAGEISIDGEAVELSSAHKAFEHGITAIHQETVLFDDLSVAENIFLGHAPRTRFGTIDWKTMRANASEVLTTMRAGHIDADARLKDLGIANKHLVAVARAMSKSFSCSSSSSRATARRCCSSATSSTRSTASPTATRCSGTARWWAKDCLPIPTRARSSR